MDSDTVSVDDANMNTSKVLLTEPLVVRPKSSVIKRITMAKNRTIEQYIFMYLIWVLENRNQKLLTNSKFSLIRFLSNKNTKQIYPTSITYHEPTQNIIPYSKFAILHFLGA